MPRNIAAKISIFEKNSNFPFSTLIRIKLPFTLDKSFLKKVLTKRGKVFKLLTALLSRINTYIQHVIFV